MHFLLDKHINGTEINSYFDITKDKIEKKGNATLDKDKELDASDINIILAGLKDTYSNDFEIFIDDLYIFDEALTAEQLKPAVKNISSGGSLELPHSCGSYHAKNDTEDLAQIKDSLAENPDPEKRRGWYYVNSHSNWADIEGCLTSGKQYVGIYDKGKDEEKDSDDTGLYRKDVGKDEATIPSGASPELEKSIKDGDTSVKKFAESPEHERSIRFYVDTEGHLRCFAWSGSTSKEGDERTFCSLVYEKKDEQITKYEALNNALNDFYKDLAGDSDLSNSAVVRFSTNNAADDLDKLIMKDWTNWSDHYQALTEEEKKRTDEELKNGYMKDLLIPEKGESSVPADTSSTEFPYVMTGGTYTWTGLKAFYENMVNKTSGRAYDIANDARDKYLIIFTDGRDNAIEETGEDDNDNVNQAPEEKTATTNSQLAGLWADKLKDEGYTIYCVMMATGSISETANQEEYGKAYKFMKTLVGANEGEERDLTDETDEDTLKKYIYVVKSNSSELNDAFAKIRNEIQQPRHDYNVQDYIDPRFDLVDGDGNLLKLGANGVITDSEGTHTVGNFIEEQDAAISYTYTPIEHNDHVDGECHIYYDDAKDMYYLRWEDQTIPMENKSFDSDKDKDADGDPKKLEVWSATIRLKAKADFIGGNNILTNGNEAGENLVYSDATIENMTEHPGLYGLGSDPSYRDKLERLSGTDRKINAVDAGGVSQAVYGDGIDIPSSGFPRTTVNVRLLKLDAKNLNDVIYMGEVVSPTMMLADLENDYMTGSYYLEYLERYAYRVYGKDAGKTALIELLNQWLQIDRDEAEKKTFTIPYMYLPDPEYDEGGNFKEISNSTGWNSKLKEKTNFADLNLQDVTGFITYTWKREYAADEKPEEQQIETNNTGETQENITKEYVVKNTNQIKYNLQLVFTPLKEEDLPDGFKLVENFIDEDHFFTINDGEFNDITAPAEKEWTITKDLNSNRTHYLKAMVKEQHTYTPHITYDTDKQKWQLSNSEPEKNDENTYDWNSKYKPAAGEKQLEDRNIKGFYTDAPNNVKLLNASGDEITDDEGAIKTSSGAPISLAANTTYVKDVVNGALALELVVDGKYLKTDTGTDPKIYAGKNYTFIAKRYYDDPNDPLPYEKSKDMNASTGADGKKYQLTFTVDNIPDDPQESTIYPVWATLTEVKVEDGSDYKSITDDGYTAKDALPIGTYVISTTENNLETDNFKIGVDETVPSKNIYFKYLKADNTASNYQYNKFPNSVYEVSQTAFESTKDPEYLIKNGAADNAPKNITVSNRTKDTVAQTVTFYFGTVEDAATKGKKGVSRTELKEGEGDYAKDRLGIILLSVDPNSLTISKEVTNYKNATDLGRSWEFTITVKPDGSEATTEFETQNTTGFDLKWYTLQSDDSWKLEETPTSGHQEKINFTKGSDGTYTATIYLKHNEKVVINGLSDGTWQVKEEEPTDKPLYTPHNNANEYSEEEWMYRNSDETSTNTLTPISQVDFVNEFPYPLPSAGGKGIDRYIFFGTMTTVAAILLAAMLWQSRRKRRTKA